MCMLCATQMLFRRTATMLPWLIVSHIALWALSQLLPPGFWFEFTSPRLSCALSLLITLFWYEVLMPQLTAWCARRAARLRERRHIEAMELQKLRKTATRRCRNCLTPYKDQKPSCGRFMCSYCGHISKRPVLEIPATPTLMNNTLIVDLLGRDGRIWNCKRGSNCGVITAQDWYLRPNCGPEIPWRRNRSTFLSRSGHCFVDKSRRDVNIFVRDMLVFFSVGLWRKLLKLGSFNAYHENKRSLAKRDGNVLHPYESKCEKARRKAEDRRQARLEKELLQEEERKQREEVAKLVEECRKLKCDILGEHKKYENGFINLDGKQHGNRCTEKKRKVEKKKKKKDKDTYKDKLSTRNNDGEEIDKKTENRSGRNLEKTRGYGRREVYRAYGGISCVHGLAAGPAIKSTPSTLVHSSDCVNKYSDQTKGCSFQSSGSLSGIGFLTRDAHHSSSIPSKVNRSIGRGGPITASSSWKDVICSGHVNTKLASKEDDASIGSDTPQIVSSPGVQPSPSMQKKAWQQLFVSSSFNTRIVSGSNQISHGNHSPSCSQFDNPFCFGLPSPVLTRLTSGSSNGQSISLVDFQPSDVHFNFVPEDGERYNDLCSVSDPMSLLGPVSDSIDSFPSDVCTGIIEGPLNPQNISSMAETTELSPLKSLISKSHMTDGAYNTSFTMPNTSRQLTSPIGELDGVREPGMWKTWNPTSQKELGIAGDYDSWLLSFGQDHGDSSNCMMSESSSSHSVFSEAQFCQNNFLTNGAECSTGHSLLPGSSDINPWLKGAYFGTISGHKGINGLVNATEGLTYEDGLHDISDVHASDQSFGLSSDSVLPKDILVRCCPSISGAATRERFNANGLVSIPDL